MKGCCFANIPDMILHYRVGNNQVTHQKYDEMTKCSNKISVEYLESVGKPLINFDQGYEIILDEAIELHNNEKINFTTLKFIYYLM